MAKRKRQASRLPLPLQHMPPRKRSYEVQLWALGAAALIGFPLLRDATSDPMQRNVYANRSNCECEYATGCAITENGRWVGPWYAINSDQRKADDPGEGGTCGGQSRNGSGGYHSYRGDGQTESRVGVEKGYRGGFGGSARVRGAGS